MGTPRLLAITLVLWATAAPARAQEEAEPPVSWEIGAVSDYRFRGVSQTDGKPALQGGVTVEAEAGWYLGGWASGVDFGAGGPRVEIDWTVGYARDLGESVELDVSLNRYSYPGARALDYNEWIASLTVFDDYRLSFGYSNDVWNTGTTGLYCAAEAQWALPNALRLSAGVGRNVYRDSAATGVRDYTDWNLRISRRFGAADIALGYHGTNATARADFGRTADGRLVLMVKIAR